MAVKVDIHARDLEVSSHLHDYIVKRASKLDRYISTLEEARIELTHIKSARSASDRNVVQITLRGKGFILRAEERTDDIYAAFDAANDKIQRQIERYKGKHYRGRGDGVSLSGAAREMVSEDYQLETRSTLIKRRKKFTLTPMDEVEAIEQMKLLGHDDFFVFYNVETGSVNVIYLRRDGSYGLIETEHE